MKLEGFLLNSLLCLSVKSSCAPLLCCIVNLASMDVEESIRSKSPGWCGADDRMR